MKYKTRQRQALLEYLKAADGRHVTVAEILEHFRALARPIGVTTVYRQVEDLVREGVVQKFIIDANSPACFAYVGAESAAGKRLHCKCQRCGRLLHIACPEFEAMERHLSGAHDFQVDPQRTVLYGLCPTCREAAPGDEPSAK